MMSIFRVHISGGKELMISCLSIREDTKAKRWYFHSTEDQSDKDNWHDSRHVIGIHPVQDDDPMVAQLEQQGVQKMLASIRKPGLPRCPPPKTLDEASGALK